MTHKNINILPNIVVPVEIRVEVYKKAINIVKGGVPKHGVFPHALCLLLPCVMWNLEHYCDNAPCGIGWNYPDVPNMFPEFTKARLNKIKDIDWIEPKLKDKARINALRGMIRQAEQEITRATINEIRDLI